MAPQEGGRGQHRGTPAAASVASGRGHSPARRTSSSRWGLLPLPLMAAGAGLGPQTGDSAGRTEGKPSRPWGSWSWKAQ